MQSLNASHFRADQQFKMILSNHTPFNKMARLLRFPRGMKHVSTQRSSVTVCMSSRSRFPKRQAGTRTGMIIVICLA
jgi:hypothetical protein